MKNNITIHFGASTWTAKVRHEGQVLDFDLRKMAARDQHNFRRTLVQSFAEQRA